MALIFKKNLIQISRIRIIRSFTNFEIQSSLFLKLVVVLAKIQWFRISKDYHSTLDNHLIILRGKNCVLLSSVQEFIEIEA